MDMELVVKNAVRGVMEGGTIREAGFTEFVRSLKRMIRRQKAAPASLDDMLEAMLQAGEATIRATDAAARNMRDKR